MKAVSLCFHDAVNNADFDASGFPGPSAAAYKLPVDDMDRHLAAIEAMRTAKPFKADDFAKGASHQECPLFLTFDDGGVSASTYIADLLEKRGWFGHFFITAGRVGTAAFLSREQVRDLRRRGHVIGSHSWSHPTRMANCDAAELRQEWTSSVTYLSELLGEQVDTASVPGGYYSARVAEAAADAGVRILFNSEPQKRVTRVKQCIVLGRYSLLRNMPAACSAKLSATTKWSSLQIRQYMFWNAKKVLKRVGGRGYLAVRKLWLQRQHQHQR